MKDKGFVISVTNTAKEFIAKQGYDPQYGARPLNRAIQKYLEYPIAEEILKNAAKEGDTLLADYEEESKIIKIEVKKIPKRTPKTKGA